MTPNQHSAPSTWHPAPGYTFVELLVVATIVMILASAVLPLAKVTATRQREADLRRSLREMRTAIDRFKDAADLGQISTLELRSGTRTTRPTCRRSSTAFQQPTTPPDANSSSCAGSPSIR